MSKRLNVRFVVYDDLRPELGCYGVDWMKTPAIDKLSAGLGQLKDREGLAGEPRPAIISAEA